MAQICGLDSVLMRKLLKSQGVHKLKLCKMRKVKAQREGFCWDDKSSISGVEKEKK